MTAADSVVVGLRLLKNGAIVSPEQRLVARVVYAPHGMAEAMRAAAESWLRQKGAHDSCD